MNQPAPLKKVFGLTIGDLHITDLLDAKPEEIDLPAIEKRLRTLHRFSGDPGAHTVHQHRFFVAHMAKERGEPDEVVQWCLYHDHHEAIIGDIPGPLKKLIRLYTNVLDDVERSLDRVICAQAGFPYPSIATRARVHHYDKMAETLEWLIVLGRPPGPWTYPIEAQDQIDFSMTALQMKHWEPAGD